MERAKLIVKNFGPLKDIEIEVREMVAFIGAQASGKSTLAKLISIFEDESFRRDSKITFEDELKKYNLISYLKKETYIKYDNIVDKNKHPFEFEYLNSDFFKITIQNILDITKELSKNDKVDITEYLNHIIDDINWDLNNFLSPSSYSKIATLFEDQNQKDIFIDYILESIKKREKINVSRIIQILNREESLENYLIFYEEIMKILPEVYNNDSIYISAERNFLHLISENALGLINNNIKIPKHLLNIGQEYEKAIQTVKELPLDIINKNFRYIREGKTSYIYHNENEKIDLLESASGLQSIIPILLLIEYSKSLKEEYNFNFVVEEPELNLYPKAQHELIKYLVKNCLFDRKNLIVTTHSPFVLASINNLLLAHDKGQKFPKEVNKIIKKESWLNPKNFIAYELKNGKAKKIMNDKLGQISENMIDGVSDAFANEFDKLLDL